MKKDLTPNHTQTPNFYFDEVMHLLTGAEYKCLMYIARRTYGFHKRADRISVSQFENGIKTKDKDGNKKHLDHGTGLCRRKIIDALSNLCELGLVEKTTGKINEYGLVQKVHPQQLVQKMHGGGAENAPEVVQKVHPQKKEKESIQKKVYSEQSSPPDYFKENKQQVRTFFEEYEQYEKYPNKDYPVLENCAKHFKGKGYSLKEVLDVYEKFYYYWTEPVGNKTKWEKQLPKGFSLKGRLATFFKK